MFCFKSTKWYTGHVSENSEISYDKTNLQADDLLYGYISTHGNQEIQRLFVHLQQFNDTSVHTALEDIRARVAEFDKFKKLEDLQVFMGYLERRLRGIHSNKSIPTQTRIANGSSSDSPSADTLSLKSRSSSNGIKETNPTRQIGRQQQFRATQQTNGHHPIPPRRASQSSSNQGKLVSSLLQFYFLFSLKKILFLLTKLRRTVLVYQRRRTFLLGWISCFNFFFIFDKFS